MDDADPANLLTQFLIILLLTLVNAFFAAAEMAVVSLNKTRIKILAEDGNKNAILLEKLLDEPTKFLSTIQVAITLAGFFSSAAAATGVATMLSDWLGRNNIPYGPQISIVAVTLILSYFTLVFGELYPKRLALKKAEKFAMAVVRPILFVQKLFTVFVKLLSVSTNVLVKITGLSGEDMDDKISKEEIQSLVEEGQEHGVINETEREMIESVFAFDDKTAEEVMTPRTEVYMINVDTHISEYMEELLSGRYSRIPVYEEDIDNIIGILYMKDFMAAAYKVGFDDVKVRDLLHPAHFVPESKSIPHLFKELQTSKIHMAILIDEYGGFSGIVTIEDLIEEIMGDIDDEFDDASEPEIQKIDNETYMVSGQIPIDELIEELELGIAMQSEDYDTLGGFLLKSIGYIPKDGEKNIVEFERVVFKIEQVKDKRIEKVKVCLLP